MQAAKEVGYARGKGLPRRSSGYMDQSSCLVQLSRIPETSKGKTDCKGGLRDGWMDARFATSRKNGPEGPGTIEGRGKYLK
jgi:hypothetical protein